MFQKKLLFLAIILLTSGDIIFASERLLQLKIGPAWVKELQWSENPTSWDASIQSGLIFDKKLSFGGELDFLWNINKKATNIRNNTYRLEKIERTFMFPVSGFFALDPIPDFRVHPCASIQMGLNTMYYSHKEKENSRVEDIPDNTLIDENGWYMGFYLKIAVDAAFNLGEQSALFAGLDYRWSKPNKLGVKSGEIFTQRNMSGVGIKMGFRVIY